MMINSVANKKRGNFFLAVLLWNSEWQETFSQKPGVVGDHHRASSSHYRECGKVVQVGK
jgi:hypothetical protein